METMLTHKGQVSTIRIDSPIAQLVEQRTVNPCVPGSSPGWGATFKARLFRKSGFFVLLLPSFYDLIHPTHLIWNVFGIQNIT